MTQVFCFDCKKSIPPTGPMIVVMESYLCGDCAYKREHGTESWTRQVTLSKYAKGKCVCNPQKVKRRWDGNQLSVKTIHDTGCPKRQAWMDLV